MSVERIDLTDVLGTSPGYAYAATATGGTHVYTAGAVPVDAEGNLIGRDDLETQMDAVLANLQQALDRTEVTADDVVKTTIYVVARDQADLPRAWRAFASSPLAGAPSTLVGVTHLGYGGQLVEIEAIAVRTS
jgi:enamine deaminase RidA (YjgF/YER057c/UK114 family)